MKELLWRLLEKSRMLILRGPKEAWKAAAVRRQTKVNRLEEMTRQGHITELTKMPILKEKYLQLTLLYLCLWRAQSWLNLCRRLGKIQRGLNISQKA